MREIDESRQIANRLRIEQEAREYAEQVKAQQEFLKPLEEAACRAQARAIRLKTAGPNDISISSMEFSTLAGYKVAVRALKTVSGRVNTETDPSTQDIASSFASLVSTALDQATTLTAISTSPPDLDLFLSYRTDEDRPWVTQNAKIHFSFQPPTPTSYPTELKHIIVDIDHAVPVSKEKPEIRRPLRAVYHNDTGRIGSFDPTPVVEEPTNPHLTRHTTVYPNEVVIRAFREVKDSLV